MNDRELAEFLASEPRVRRDGDRLTIQVRERYIPPRPDVCPECGEPYEKRKFGGDVDEGTYTARYYHYSGGFGGPSCVMESDWRDEQTVTVDIERAKRVSGGYMEARA